MTHLNWKMVLIINHAPTYNLYSIRDKKFVDIRHDEVYNIQ